MEQAEARAEMIRRLPLLCAFCHRWIRSAATLHAAPVRHGDGYWPTHNFCRDWDEPSRGTD